MRLLWILGLLFLFCQSCSVSKSNFNINTKFSPALLQKDYDVFQSMLEESHPGLYWYTPKDSMNYYFNWGKKQLKDSMTEDEFRKTLTYVISKLNCGHTTVRSSVRYNRSRDSLRTKVFPLSLKLWDDTMIVTANLNRNDSIFKRGTVIKKINNKSFHELIDTFSKYISSDGYNYTHKLQSLSNRSSFGSAYKLVYGLPSKFDIIYTDSAGRERKGAVSLFNPIADSAIRNAIARFPARSKKERKKTERLSIRSLRIDSATHTAFMDLNSFARGYALQRFFRRSFRSIKKNNINNLVIDVRGNGGGSVTNSTLITKYISANPFKVADSLYAISRRNSHGRYIENYFFNRLFMLMMTRKKNDGYYHFGYYERHFFKPKKKNHFDGRVYILTGGNSFSATTLFAQAVKAQENVFIVGEETGGGAYGNTAWLIPEATLPNTRIKFRLPLFRLVINKNIPKNGRGILPEIEVKPTASAILRGADYKMDKVIQLIKASSQPSAKEKETSTQPGL